MIGERFSVSVGGAQLAGRRLGEGLPVVFLHAGVCDKRMWQSQMEMVAEEGWQGIAYDRRGYGETESDDVAFNHVDDLEAFLKALDIHAAVFVGCSMGGGLAIDFALRNPGQVMGLVLIGTSVTGAPWIDNETEAEKQLWAVEEDAHERGDLDMINRVQAHIWLDGPRTSGGRVTGAARELFLDMNGIALRKPALTLEEKRESAWDRLGQVGAPTLLLVGDEDVSAIIERHEILSEEMPNAFAAVLEGMAHIPSIERPELVNSMILEFLDAIEGGDDEDEDEDFEGESDED